MCVNLFTIFRIEHSQLRSRIYFYSVIGIYKYITNARVNVGRGEIPRDSGKIYASVKKKKQTFILLAASADPDGFPLPYLHLTRSRYAR